VHIRSSDYKEVKVDIPNKGPKTIKVSADSSKDELEAYKALFLEFQDVFAWSYTDLKGIPAHIAQHTITLLPSIKPIRQKQRRLNPHMQLVLKAKPERLLKAGFIKPVDLVDWVSPMVLVRKKNGKLRVCIDYRALNKYTAKDHFPLPFLNIILEEVAGKELYTYLDGYSGYNQIGIHPSNWHKTAFTTPWGTFIFIVMPFGLCNAPATFQRAIMFVFSKLLLTTMTVYIDDFSVQSSVDEHLKWVRECLI
jgi:hypothetical protein